MDTNQIIALCRKNDPKGQRELVCQFAPKLLTVARRYVGNTMDAEDVLQNAFIKIFGKLDQFNGAKGSFEGWMRKIVVNTALNELRKRKAIVPSDMISEEIHAVQAKVYQKLDAEEIMAHIEKLPTMYRTVFNLFAIEGFSHKEIADMLNIMEASSRSNLSRAREILRKSIYEYKKHESWQRIV